MFRPDPYQDPTIFLNENQVRVRIRPFFGELNPDLTFFDNWIQPGQPEKMIELNPPAQCRVGRWPESPVSLSKYAY